MHRHAAIPILLLLLGTARLHAVEPSNTDEPSADRPNIVWLVSEDSSKHYFRLFDPHGAETPRIARLAEHGLLFEHAFSNSPVCSVARTTLITGCYAPRIGTQYHRRSVTVPLPSGLRMFPAYLREAGYYTTNKQKKDYNAKEGPGVWDESSRRASWRNRKPGQPFFHMQSFGTSHESSLHFSEAAMRKEKTAADPEKVHLAPYHPDTKTFRYTVARYLDRIREIDGQIGAVVDELSKDGLLEDTFIFFFGDHGGVLPRSKGYVYESGLHVPLVVRVPEKWKDLAGRELGTRVGGFVSFVDFGSTVLRLAGVGVPDAMDGRPFLGKGVDPEEVDRRDEAYGYADRFDEKIDFVRSLRKGSFKYIRSYQPFNFDALQNNYRYKMLAYVEWRTLWKAGKLRGAARQFFERRAPEALYDLTNDPDETKNLAGDAPHAATLTELRGRLQRWVKALPDLSFYPESVLVEKAFDDPTGFGNEHRQDIAELVDIADLSLLPFEEARAPLVTAFESKDPWKRYQALIAASSHGEAARSLAARARALSSSDEELLVRVRAAEFLGLIGAEDPRAVILEALEKTDSGVEACLVLNSVVLLEDGKPGYDFPPLADRLQPDVRSHDGVKRRLAYLDGE